MLKHIIKNIDTAASGLSAGFSGVTLETAFQPIISLAHHRAVGFEALVRGYSQAGKPVYPPAIFSLAQTEFDIVYLDRLCRALHVSNFKQANHPTGWLFLNINPNVIVHGKKYGTFFRELLAAAGLSPDQIVVEILENTLVDEPSLDNCVAFYRDLGCLIAIDDFGAGSSNFQRIWRLKPHIVKLDRSIICNAANDVVARRMLPNIVNTLHEAGSLVLVEGIENEAEAMIAMETSAELVQGYYFGRPVSGPIVADSAATVVSELFTQYREVLGLRQGGDKYQSYVAALEHAVACLEGNAGIFSENLDCFKPLLVPKGGECCYLLDHHGKQLGETCVNQSAVYLGDRHFKPLESGQGAIWIRRPYWLRAMSRPGEVQCTRPYLSIRTGRLCVTLSLAYDSREGIRVLCFDLDCEAAEGN